MGKRMLMLALNREEILKQKWDTWKRWGPNPNFDTALFWPFATGELTTFCHLTSTLSAGLECKSFQGKSLWLGGFEETFCRMCSSALPFSMGLISTDFWPLLFKVFKSCSFYFNAYFYLNYQNSSCSRRDTGTCYLGGGSAGGGVASVPGGNTDPGEAGGAAEPEVPQRSQGCDGLHYLGAEPCRLLLHMSHRKG